jgi:hypothetical protein
MYVCVYVRRITYPFDDIISCSFSLLLSIKVTMQTKELYVRVKKLIWVKAFFLLFRLLYLLIYSIAFHFHFHFSFVVATVDPCSSYQCNQGTCQKDRSSKPYCSCYEGYGGSRCETQIGMFRIERKKMNIYVL